MAKQRDDDLRKPKRPRPDDLEIVSEEELETAEPVEDVIEAAEVVEEASAAPKTPSASKAPPRGSQPPRKAAPTLLARGEPDEIAGRELRRPAGMKDAPQEPPVPNLSLDGGDAEEVFEAEAVVDGPASGRPGRMAAEEIAEAEEVFDEAQPATPPPAPRHAPVRGDIEDIFAEEVTEAQPASGVVRPESPPPRFEDLAFLDDKTIAPSQPAAAESPPPRLEKTAGRRDEAAVADSGEYSAINEADLLPPSGILKTGAPATPPPQMPKAQAKTPAADEIFEALEQDVPAPTPAPKAARKQDPAREPEADEVFEALEQAPPLRTPPPGKIDREAEADEILEALEKAPPQNTPVPAKGAKDEEAEEVFEALEKGPADSDIFSDSSGEVEALGSGKTPKAEPPKSPIPRKTAPKGKSSLKDMQSAETEEMKLEEFDDKPVAKKKRTGADEVTEDMEEAEVDERPRDRRPPPKPRRPKRLRHWVGGFFLALFLVAGGAAAVWYLKPELIYEDGLPLIPKSPNAKHEYKVVPQTQLTKLQGDADSFKTKAEKAQQSEKAAKKSLDELKDSSEGTITELQGKIKQAEQTQESLKTEIAKLKESGSKQVGELEKAMAKLESAKKDVDRLVQGVQKALVNAKALDPKDKLDVKTFDNIVKDFQAAKTGLMAVNDRLKEANIKDGGEKGLQTLLADYKGVGDKLKDINKRLESANVKGTEAKGVEELIGSLKDAQQKLQSPLVVPLSQALATLNRIGVGGVEMLRRGFDDAALVAELALFRAREPLIQPPQAKLDTWLALLRDRNYGSETELGAAVKEADWLRSPESKADAVSRAKALAVTGLVLRNQGKYAAARKALAAAVKEAEALKDAGPWGEQTAAAFAELTDARAYYLPRIEKLQEQGKHEAALAELATALKVIPDDARLRVQRGLLRLEVARSQKKPIPEAEIRADAEAALKDAKTAADAAFTLGRLEEAIGQLDMAEKHYRAALQAAGPEAQNKYRIALAKLLLRDHPAGAAPAEDGKNGKGEEKKGDEGKGEAAPAPPKEDTGAGAAARSSGRSARRAAQRTACRATRSRNDTAADPRAALVALLITGAQPGMDDDEDPAEAKRINESLKLAEQLIKSEKKEDRAQGHMIKGQALAKLGKRTEGLREFTEGLKILFPGSSTSDLSVMLEKHPAFMTPSPPVRPNPFAAEQHFGRGLHFYWEGVAMEKQPAAKPADKQKRFDEAEQQFVAAVGYFPEDARYWYFLGLARLAQPGKGKRDAAYYAFEQGARREAEGHPSTSEIAASLERIQGQLRVFVNSYREKGLRSGPPPVLYEGQAAGTK